MKLIKKIKTFFLERNYLWLNPRFKDTTPEGLLLYKDRRPNLFFSAKEFAYALHDLTGKKIYMPQVQHCQMKALHPRGGEFPAWLWKGKKFCYFAPIGTSEIFLALNRQYQTFPLRRASVQMGKYDTSEEEAEIILSYRVSEELKVYPVCALLNSKTGLQFVLAQYAPKDKLQTALTDIQNWKKKKLDLHSCSNM